MIQVVWFLVCAGVGVWLRWKAMTDTSLPDDVRKRCGEDGHIGGFRCLSAVF